RHRARHGVCAKGLPPGRHHGRQLLDRAAQADAHAGREGGADAACAEGVRHVPEGGRAGEDARLVPGAPVRDAGERLDWFVTGYGTGGTLAGVARVLRKERPDTKIALCEPANAQLIGSGKAQERAADGSPASGHPAFEPHHIQGWTPDFIPLVLQEAIDKKYFDRRIAIAGAEGIKWAKALAQKEGIFCGISSGSTFAVAMQIAEQAPAGSVILAMLPDTGERYLTTPMFEGIIDDMDAEEIRISKSTPGYQMPA